MAADGGHEPVLLAEVTGLLAPAPGEVVLDGTVGLGGHARRLAESVGESGVLIGMDVDESNLRQAGARLAGVPCAVHLVQGNFRDAAEALRAVRIEQVDVCLLDLGVSSTQLDDAARGLSFQRDGPLDMRLDDRLAETAADLVNRLSEADLADVIYQNGQERFSRRIARAIVRARHGERIRTTGALVDVVCRALRVSPTSRAAKIHPATRTFQALRIAVNDELGALTEFLKCAPALLRADGRVGVIAFHSLEDGLVKRDFRSHASDDLYRIVTKKPLTASATERARNPRSRSAKLRVAQRTDKPVG